MTMIRPVDPGDGRAICAIYNHYIENTTACFEEILLSTGEMEERIRKISAKYPYLVLEEDGELTGYAYANTWKERPSYRHSAEISVYLKNGYQGKGRGKELLGKLIGELRGAGLHAIVAGIVLPNEGSVGMCEKFGFRKIGQFNEIGFKKGKWLDVGYWELVFN